MFEDYTRRERIVILISGVGLMALATLQLFFAVISI
jgi:hypothetical protein